MAARPLYYNHAPSERSAYHPYIEMGSQDTKKEPEILHTTLTRQTTNGSQTPFAGSVPAPPMPPLPQSGWESTNPNDSIVQAVKKCPKLAVFLLNLSMSFLLYGVDSAEIGTLTTMSGFLGDYGKPLTPTINIVATPTVSLWRAMSPVAAVAGALLTALLVDRTGRKAWYIASTLVAYAGITFQFVSRQQATPSARGHVLTVGRAICGVAIGALTSTSFTWISELSPVRLRPLLIPSCAMFTAVGYLVAGFHISSQAKFAMDSPIPYQIAIASEWGVLLVPLLSVAFGPESPIHLIRRSRPQEACRAISVLSKPGTDINAIYESLARDIDNERGYSAGDTVAACFHPRQRRRTWIAIFAILSPQLWGLAIISNCTTFYQSTLVEPKFAITLGILGFAILQGSVAISIYLNGRFPRRLLAVASLAIVTALWLAVAVSGFFKISTQLSNFGAITTTVLAPIAGIGCWPALWLVGSEVTALRLRAKTVGLAFALMFLLQAVIYPVFLYMVSPLDLNLSRKPALIIAILSLLATVATWAFVPETKGRRQTEVDRLFDLRISARRWVGQ